MPQLPSKTQWTEEDRKRFAEAIVDDDTPSVARGNKLLLEVESTTNLSLNSSDEIHARIVLAKVIQRLAVDRAERNQSMPTGLLLAFDRLQILSGRIVEAENGSRFKEIKLQCNLQGLTFVACTQTSNGICGVPSCIAQNPVNVNASIQCPPGSQYQGICTLSFPKVCSSVCICGLDGRPYENSKCANHSITTCVFGSGMLVNNQLACDKMTNNIVTCKFGEIIDTGRRCGIQGIFGGNR